jgi:micrococcal nuclease
MAVRLAVLVSLLLPACAARASGQPTTAVVDYVVDGDTLDVLIDGKKERVRLIGIDTPETKKKDTPVECFGPEASDHLRELLPAGTAVRLERDVVGRDDYGRLLAYAYRSSDGLFVNLDIVAKGFAQPLTIPPNVNFSEQFVEAARVAERSNVGLWASCGG